MAIELSGDRNAPGRPLAHFWNFCVGAGRANEGLRAAWLDQLVTAVRACGFRYLRFHGLFHDDMFVYREIEGRVVYNFQYVDELFDRMLDRNVRPFVELGFCPGDLATEKNTVFWWNAHGSPPNDMRKWTQLVERFIRHCLDRYGPQEVRQWYFEVWNEPNLSAFFRGTRSQYFQLYRETVRAIKQIDPALRVGGPGTSNFVPDSRFDGETEDRAQHATVANATDLSALDWRPVWVKPFLEFCRQNKLPVDFVSCHPYPTDWAIDSAGQGRGLTRGVDATPKDLHTIRSVVADSTYPNAEIHLTEWNSSPSPRDYFHDVLPQATFAVKAHLESLGQVNSVSYWTFSDIFEENGAGDLPFHGGFGLINFQGIVKPVFHAYRMLSGLGDELLSTATGGIVTRRGGGLSAMAYHYPTEMSQQSFDYPLSLENARKIAELGQPEELAVNFTGLPPRGAMQIETLDASHGNAMTAWEAMGSPASLSRPQAGVLRQISAATKLEVVAADETGRLSFRRAIEPWSIVLIRQLPTVD